MCCLNFFRIPKKFLKENNISTNENAKEIASKMCVPNVVSEEKVKNRDRRSDSPLHFTEKPHEKVNTPDISTESKAIDRQSYSELVHAETFHGNLNGPSSSHNR